MRVAHDHRAPRLPEDLRQRDRRDPARADQVCEHIARADTRQLVGVAHHHKAAAGFERRQKRAHQRKVDHRHFVHDHRVRLERLFLVFSEGDLAGDLVPAHAEQPVERLRLFAADLAHPLGGASRRRGKHHVKSHAHKQLHDRAHACCFTGAGTTGEQQQFLLCRQLHRLALKRRVFDALLLFDFIDGFLRAPEPVRLVGEHGAQPRMDVNLRFEAAAQVARLHVRDLLLHDLAALKQVVKALFHRVRVRFQQLRRRREQLLPRQENVSAALFVVRQLKEQPRLRAQGRVAGKAHGKRDLVAGGKFHAIPLSCEQIRVSAQRRHRVRAEAAVERHGERHRQLIAREKFHQPPQTHLLAERLADLAGALIRDALDGLQPLRLGFDDIERFRTEAIHQLLRRRRSDPADHTGGKIVQNFRFVGGHASLHLDSLELVSVLRMRCKDTRRRKLFTGRGTGDTADDGQKLPVPGHQAQHGIAVFLILKNDGKHRAHNGRLFPHADSPVSTLKSAKIPLCGKRSHRSCGGRGAVQPSAPRRQDRSRGSQCV